MTTDRHPETEATPPLPEPEASRTSFIFRMFLDPSGGFRAALAARGWWASFAFLALTYALIDFNNLAGAKLPSDLMRFSALVIGFSGLLTIIYWPLYSFITIFGGPRILGGKGSFKDSLLVAGAAAAPIGLIALVILPLETIFLKPYLPGALTRLAEEQPVLFSIVFGFNWFLSLWWLALTIWGSKLIHELSTIKTIAGFFLLPLVFFVIGLIRMLALL